MKARLILCLAVLCGALQACDQPGEWSAAEAPRQLRVDFQRLTHAAGFAPSSPRLAQSEQESLNAFLRAGASAQPRHIMGQGFHLQVAERVHHIRHARGAG